MKRAMKITLIDGRVYLFPVPVVKERKYLISCSTEQEALLVSKAIEEGTVVHPDLISNHFLFLTLHTDKQTKIFYLNPAVTLGK